MSRALVCFLLLTIFAGGGCSGDCDPRVTYYCLYDENCAEEQGEICVFDGETGKYCAIVDTACPSGRKWVLAGKTNHNCECVPPELLPAPDGGVDTSTVGD
jgi:hypothetical protein